MRRKWMRRWLVGVAVASAVGAGVWAQWPSSASAEGASAEGGPKAVIKNEELMKLMFDPYYVDLRKSLAEEPASGKVWRQAYIATYRLCEVTNLLYLRDDKDYMGTPEWREEVEAASAASVALGEAVKQLDYGMARERYEALIQRCNACHERFEPTKPTAVMP